MKKKSGLTMHRSTSLSCATSSLFVIGCLCFVFAVPAFPAEITDARILDYGIYTSSVAYVISDTNSPTSRVRFETLKVAKETVEIPAKLNTKFGFQFNVHGTPAGESVVLRCVYLFPEMTNPASGAKSVRYEYAGRARLEGKTLGMFWTFMENWEMVTGKWTLQIFNNDIKLLEKSFKVVPADR